MTSEFEKRALERCMPWAGSRLRVIPIGSNIPRQPHAVEARNEAIVYFGLIMERKGLEDFIEFSRLVRARSLEWDLSIIGKIAPGKADYCKTLMDSSRPYGVRWILDRDANEVSELLSRAGLAYLPFPDGASERRGSLKAALVAGIPCITRCTEQTSQELFEAVTPAATPLAAVDLAVRLMAAIEDRRRLSRNALEYSKQFSWEKIAESHMQMYEELFAANKNTRK
ncbi:MAG: hypothetical protein P4L40_09515 [Terracidiphilus sp.]|nr:hypothetical protein [Terracidiphilus sp.]